MKKILAYFLVAGLLFPYSAWAVCPVVETVAISHDASATESTKTHDLPTGIVSGDMLVLFFSEMDGRTATVTGWTPLLSWRRMQIVLRVFIAGLMVQKALR